MRYFFIIAPLISILSSSAAFAESDPRVGRYTTVAPTATPSQHNLLSVVVDISFSSNITTVGDALTHLLLRSGYRLADMAASDPYLPILFTRPLPHVHRKLGPITLKNALTALAGPAWHLSVDPVNRLISYELLREFRPADFSAPTSSTSQRK